MKKGISIILIFALLLVAVVFCALWQKELHDKSDFEAVAQANATESYTHFLDYQKTCNEADYWGGVSAFYAFFKMHIAFSKRVRIKPQTALSVTRSMAAFFVLQRNQSLHFRNY